MGNSMVRQFDNAAGIAVLLLLAVAVVGGQSTTSPETGDARGINVSATHRISGPGKSTPAGQEPGPSGRKMDVELEFPATDFMQDFRLRDSDDDRPALLDD